MAGEVKRKRRREPGVVKDRIDLVGIELEGGWLRQPSHHEVIRDGSVHVEPELVPGEVDLKTGLPKMRAAKYIGEIVSQPMRATDFPAWMKACYPEFVNGTCGLHVHMSFTSKLNYQRLMTPEFTKLMIKRIGEWAKKEGLPENHWIWPRLLDPNHNHCAHLYLGDGQVKMAKKDFHSRGTTHSRYTAINYCYGQHKTIECRLLSMVKDVDMAIRGVQVVLDTTNEFLAKMRERERKVAAGVEDTPTLTTQLHQFV